MSSQETIQEQSDNVAVNYANVAAFAYDTLLTFPSEVRFIWHKKFKLGTILYLLARYPALLVLLLNVYLNFETFLSLQTYSLLFARAYAISSHNKLVFVVLALLGATAIGLSMVALDCNTDNNCISISNVLALCKMLNPILKNRVHKLCSVITLNGVFTILYDTAVFVAILQNTLGLLQLQSGIPGVQRNSLSKLLVQQGILRYGFVVTITLASTVTDKVLRPTLQEILGTLQNSLSIIIICRFHLALQQRNDHPNGSNTSHSLPLGSFHAVKERIHRAVVNEFGDMSFNESLGTEEDIELQAMQSPSGVAEIDLQEFPWAGGDIGDGEARPVASDSGILRE
ncbi:hypothetical protein K439DRAFT_1620294 [Ramaria rubella]|nr:hypothetical protein K439DRAFT_1620294 [Ramaria rubella]